MGGATTLSVDSQPEPGIQIAGYRIEARVGRGGMGDVYRAVQLSLGRRVALKVLAPKLADDVVFRRRFLRESRIAASIDHPNVIPIYESGEDGGLLYIAMRYVDGSDLATLLEQEGRLDPARAMAIMTQVASALDAAHARGLVHRDVKPANILLAGGGGHCYLCDFGLIKQVDPEQALSALTAADQFVGTIPYVAPEQIEGREVDGRTDVYALGCVLFHCLTGSVPFPGEGDVEVVFAHLREPPPPISRRAPGLPAAMDAVIARAMAKAKEDRWPTCSELVAALAALLRTAPRRPATAIDDQTAAGDATVAMAPPPAPPLARSARRPQGAGSASGPQEGERSGPGGGVPAEVHRGDRGGRVYRGDRRRGRWLTVAAAIVLPVVAYLAAVQLLSGGQPQVVAAPGSTVTTTERPATTRLGCPGGFTRPEVGTADRTAPLAAIRSHMGWSDRFVVEEMRTWRGSDGQRRWYVKAQQEDNPSRRGRWLVLQDEDGQRLVVATAPFATQGYAARDWRPAEGQAVPAGVAGCLAGT
jgi:tRNA A-37 threonylcarbamoyl transferase component Bud32